MPFHSDNRGLASTSEQKTHCDVEKLWGKQVSKLFHVTSILKKTPEQILEAEPPEGSQFAGLDFGQNLGTLRNGGDPWKEAVYTCRAGFAASFAMVPPDVAAVDDRKRSVSLKDILDPDGFCGDKRFWNLSRAIMIDAANAIARFWQDVWVDFTSRKS